MLMKLEFFLFKYEKLEKTINNNSRKIRKTKEKKQKEKIQPKAGKNLNKILRNFDGSAQIRLIIEIFHIFSKKSGKNCASFEKEIKILLWNVASSKLKRAKVNQSLILLSTEISEPKTIQIEKIVLDLKNV